MGTITTLRPSATSSGVGWTPSAGTLHGATSDDSDATHADWSGSGSPMILATPADAPPVGERRHQVRLRARGEDGDAWWAVRLTSGGLVAGAAASFPSSPSTVTGSWGFGAPADGSTVLSTYVTAQSAGLKIEELYLDVDTRLAPTFTLSVLDGSGTPSASISDTAQPTVSAGSLDLDGLQARQFRYWVTLGSDIVWDTGVVSGPSTDQQTAALDNGTYTAHAQIWTTLGSNTAYASDEETSVFTISVGSVPAPDNPTVTPVPDSPFYSVEACAPYAGDFDDGQAWVEVQRVDCPGDGQRVTTVAILGPLETDECATYVDYSLPRTGIGATCDHDPELCCSYYRARTLGRVDGSLQISDWSDAYDPGIPSGLIFLWPSTNASIPSGWDRVTALDSRYPKGIASSVTEPGATGGAAAHNHTVTAHSHDVSHVHTTTAVTSAAVGTFSSTPNTVGTANVAATHTHTTPSTNSATVSSGTTSPAIDSPNNDPDRFLSIFIESNGQPLGVPDGGAAITPDISLSGWTDYANATSRFMKGATAAGDGGGTGASTLNNHTHAVAAHTHTGTSHPHTSANTGSTSSALALSAGATSAVSATTHAHPITIGSAADAGLSSGGSGTSGASSSGATEPPFINMRVKQNTSGDVSLLAGLIGLWRKSLGSIPRHWALCDGTGGTPDLTGKYIKGATSSIGTTGGSATGHTHTSPSHTHTATGSHTHTMTVGAQNAATANVSTTATVSVSNGTHTHTHGSTDATTPTVGSSTSGTLASTTTEPQYEEVAFVQLTEDPAPPPAPDQWCLTWDEDEHLLRTEGPDGPMFATVGGLFTWDVDRPFTSATGVMGSRFVTSAPPGGRNLHLTTAVNDEAELATLKAVLDRPLVLVSPSDAAEVWAAPVASSVRVVKIGRIRQVTADFIATGPQPAPQLADVGV